MHQAHTRSGKLSKIQNIFAKHTAFRKHVTLVSPGIERHLKISSYTQRASVFFSNAPSKNYKMLRFYWLI